VEIEIAVRRQLAIARRAERLELIVGERRPEDAVAGRLVDVAG
jgi:hypothetical protein